ncbi:MAG: glycosyltransferase [Candidatus Liptonbacteria bacterium]|nr:glycosyltransferase [Candidatus Liptonbacteria bacterium]
MKILLVALRYFSDKAKGFKENSFEYNNYYLSLKKLPKTEVIFYPTDKLGELSSGEIRQELLEIIRSERPNVLIFVLNPYFDKEIFREITKSKKLTTIGIIPDDDGGFFDSWRHWAGCFDWVVTYYPPAVKWHKELGERVIGINWAVNPDLYPPKDTEKDIDVSFVGRGSPQRKQLIVRIEKRAGVKISCFGPDWPGGIVSHEKMLDVMSRSRINLNFSGQPLHSFLRPKSLARILIRRPPGATRDAKLMFDFKNVRGNFLTLKNMVRPMARARVFEVPAMRAFLLTGPALYFGEPFTEGKEIVHYRTTGDLILKIKYYLAHKEEREAIAEAGYQRVLRDHTFEAWFRYIFDVIEGRT